MSRPFAKYRAEPAFSHLNEPQNAYDYILKKKIKNSFCNQNLYKSNKNIYSQSNYLQLKQANKLAFYPCINDVDKSQLYINLITKLNLTEINAPIISTLAGNYPVGISHVTPEIINCIIDPSGVLFGNTVCGLTNVNNYVQYNPPYFISNPGSISNL